ncbi:MAG: oligosaccharide flippase family protein [Bacteroidota bacterium]
MISTLRKSLAQLLNEGHQRSVKAKKQILYSFLIKGGSMLIGFLTVPITLGYIHKEQYGIWITLSSVIGWFSFFDIGLGNGLRNKLSETLAENDLAKARAYVSSTYAILALIFSMLLLGFLLINPLLDWTQLLNTDTHYFEELQLTAAIVFCFFCLNFVLRLLYSIFLADQRPSRNGLFNLISNAISLGLIVLLTYTTEGSLINLALVLGCTPLVILTAASFYFFRGEYRGLSPNIRFVQKSYFKDLLSLGFRFFLVGITGIIIFSTDNVIITQIFGPAAVPAYSIAYKYFEIIISIFTIVSVPFWSAYTEAFVKKDLDWIRRTNQQLVRIWMGLVGAGLFMLLVANWFYSVWVPEIEVPFTLSALMCLYVLTLCWGNIFVVFINGVGKVQLQLLVSLVGALINIPLSYFFAKSCGLGVGGVILASTICIAYGPLLAPVQYRKIINGTARGIWNK